MPPSTATCRKAITSANHYALNGSLLPFLYCTRTIRGQHDFKIKYHNADDDFEGDAEPGQRFRQHGQKPHKDSYFKVWDEGSGRRPDTNITRNQLGDRDALSGLYSSRDGNEGTRKRYGEADHRQEQQRSEWVDHVPFELDNAAEDDEISDGTTITPAERKVFERLKAMRPALPEQKEGQPREQKDQALSDVNISPVPTRKYTQQELKTGHRNVALRAAAEADLNRVRSLMQDAQTDVDLWRIFQEQVIARVLALELDPPQNSQRKEKRKSARRRKKLAQATEAEEAPAQTAEPALSGTKSADNVKSADGITDEAILTESLPQHVLTFFRICRWEFASSSLPPSMIPYLKSLGPMTFAAAASSTLYNNHMRWLYRRYLDLPAIVSTLEEMDRDVYEFDNRTIDLLTGILKRRAWIQHDGLGESAKVLWSTPRMVSSLRAIKRWHGVVNERLQQKALREARAMEEEASTLLASGDVAPSSI